MPPTIQIDRETFLKNLRQSGLLSTRLFRQAVDEMPETPRGRVLAKTLVDRGLITKFQAELLLIGRTSGFFLGPYRILDQLGQGGMGRVFKALHQNMNRVVALKVLAPGLVKTAKAQKLFQREVRAAAQLNHTHIVTAYDAGQYNSRHFLAMEFVDGPNLDQLVRKRGALDIGVACEIIRQTALGLAHAHERGMVHRDIKPANMLVQRGGESSGPFVVKILDFGLARLNEPAGADSAGSINTPDNTVMGTPDFLSPEQARNLHDVDIRSDLYSLGCTFYFLLTGKIPYPGGTTLEKLIRHTSENPPSVRDHRPEIPEAVAAIVVKLMSKERADRFQSPLDLVQALTPLTAAAHPVLEGALQHPAISTSPLPGSGELPKKPESNPEMAVSTVPGDIAPTSLEGGGDPGTISWLGTEEPRLSRKALYWSIGIVLGGLALGTAIGLALANWK